VETNEQRKKAVRAAIQEELEGFFAQVQELSEGDLEHLEQQGVKTSQQMGRRLRLALGARICCLIAYNQFIHPIPSRKMLLSWYTSIT
jgi:hypothetical protein